VAARAASLSAEECSRAFERLRVEHLLRAGTTSAGTIEPFHDRVREAVVTGIDESRLPAHYNSLLDAFEAAGGVAAETLFHYALAANLRDRAAVHARIAAADAMRALAFVRAAELYRAALELSPADAADLPGLRAGLGAALANAGKGLDRLDEAWHALTTGTATPRSEEELLTAIRALRADARVMRLADVELLCERLEDLIGMARARAYRVSDDVDMVVTMAFQFLAMLLLRSADAQHGDIDLQGFLRQLEQVVVERLGAEQTERDLGVEVASPSDVEVREFTSDGLTIEARLSATSAHLVFRGEGEARDAAPFFASVTKELIPQLEQKKVTIDFRELRRMNSSTVASILILVRALDQKRIQTVLDYDTSIEWQRVNFQCMKAIARSLQSIAVVAGSRQPSRGDSEGRT
jgi:hypothetical protein